MPTPPLKPGHPKWELALEAYRLKSTGLYAREVAAQLGIDPKAVERYCDKVKLWEATPEGVKSSLEATGLDLDTAKHGWRIRQHEDGSRDSVFWSKPQFEQEAFEDRIAEKFHNLPKPPKIKRPKATREELRTLYPLFDVHMGLRHGSYGLQDAVARLTEGMASLIARNEPAQTAIILNGGDWTHANDNSAQTPTSKHPLDVDGSFEDAVEASIEVTAGIIEMALQKHDYVLYVPLRGNHDPQTARILRYAMAQRYRDCDRVAISDQGVIFFAHEWGRNLICAHHGDARGNGPKEMVMRFAAEEPASWGRTRHRELWTGHMHHLKAAEFPGMSWYQCRAVSGKSRFDHAQAYSSKSEMKSVTYHIEDGRVGTSDFIFAA